MKDKANNIQMDKDLDFHEEKVKSLLGKNVPDDFDAKIMAKVEERLKSMATRDKMHEHSEYLKNIIWSCAPSFNKY